MIPKLPDEQISDLTRPISQLVGKPDGFTWKTIKNAGDDLDRWFAVEDIFAKLDEWKAPSGGGYIVPSSTIIHLLLKFPESDKHVDVGAIHVGF